MYIIAAAIMRWSRQLNSQLLHYLYATIDATTLTIMFLFVICSSLATATSSVSSSFLAAMHSSKCIVSSTKIEQLC